MPRAHPDSVGVKLPKFPTTFNPHLLSDGFRPGWLEKLRSHSYSFLSTRDRPRRRAATGRHR